MGRYINIDDVTLKGVAVFDENLDFLIPLSDVRKALLLAPTADVVPREDYADQKAMGDMCAEVIARQDKDIERLREEANRFKRYFFRHDYDEMIAEVLDELDRFINSNCIEIKDDRGIKGYVTSGVHFAISELKKKYTGND